MLLYTYITAFEGKTKETQQIVVVVFFSSVSLARCRKHRQRNNNPRANVNEMNGVFTYISFDSYAILT